MSRFEEEERMRKYLQGQRRQGLIRQGKMKALDP